MSYISSDTKFIKEQDGRVTLCYSTDNYSWILEKFTEDESIKIRGGVFYLTKSDLKNKDVLNIKNAEDPIIDSKEFNFTIGKKEGDYYKIYGHILNTTHNVFFYQDIMMEEKIFLGSGRIPLFPIIDKFVARDMYVGGNIEDALPWVTFEQLRKKFPNSTEILKYKRARITSIIKDYYNIDKDYKADYEAYLNKKSSTKTVDFTSTFRTNEIAKYRAIKQKLEDMLSSQMIYSEHQWQYEILEIILLLFPKYIRVFTEVQIKDCYTKKKRRLDYMVIDAVGNIDIIEIKKPSDGSIVSGRTYRDNHIPVKELSGTVMQIEKYILYLNKWGSDGENYINEQYKSYLPKGVNVHITNPGGIIIMGRTMGLTPEQRIDFEISKRKYKNVIDIITYDDLINRLGVLINQLEGKPIVGTL